MKASWPHVVIVALLPLGGCFAGPSCQDHCDGDTIVRCEWDCPDTNDVTRLGDCERVERRLACDVGETCLMAIASNNPEGSSGTPRCEVTPIVPCDPDSEPNMTCLAPNRSGSCQSSTTGYFRSSSPFCEDQPGTECFELEQGIMCVFTDRVPCEPGEPPVCLADGQTLTRCDGRDGDYAIISTTCSFGCTPGSDSCGAP